MRCCIYYRGGYKYQLTRPHSLEVALKPDEDVTIGSFVGLTKNGTLSIGKGYAWDGPSGPTIDTPSFMQGSLVHDALYQLMRHGHLDKDRWRKAADQELERICRNDGMNWFRARAVYTAVRLFAEKSAAEEGIKPEIAAPRDCEDCAADGTP